jgi:hypothetical protein
MFSVVRMANRACDHYGISALSHLQDSRTPRLLQFQRPFRAITPQAEDHAVAGFLLLQPQPQPLPQRLRPRQPPLAAEGIELGALRLWEVDNRAHLDAVIR